MAPQHKRRRLSGAAVTPFEDVSVDVPNGNATDDAAKEQSKAAKKDDHSRQLFVRSLPSCVTQESLTQHFSQSYPLKHAIVVLDPATKQSRGFGFVTFADAEDAQRAREEFNGSTFQGHKIKVEFAEHRHRDPANQAKADERQDDKIRSSGRRVKAQRNGKDEEPAMPPKLIVRNLPWSVKEPEQLALLFRSYGKVKHAIIPKKGPGLLAGFGFVVMRGKKNAEKAIEGVNGKEVDGRTIAVDWAVEKNVWEGLQQSDEVGKKPKQDEAEVVEENEKKNEGDSVESEDVDEDNGVIHPSDPSLSEQSMSNDSDAEKSEIDMIIDEEDEVESPPKTEDNSSTLFIRNIPFTCTDQTLHEHFKRFGPVRYARVVLDATTERPKGTAFVCFYQKSDADTCLREAPTHQWTAASGNSKSAENKPSMTKHSILENELADSTGRFTVGGRVLQVSRAVNKNEALKLTEVGSLLRHHRDRDKRRLYLLSEGTISEGSALYKTLSPVEIQMREASLRQRKALINSNPSLHLSLTRLSIRNIPRTISSKELKALARQAVVGFAKDVKNQRRLPISKEELDRGGQEMKDAERERRAKGRGIVKQAKIVFEGLEGGKITEESGAGRSRGYGFIEYTSHRWALMGLRWLNGHAVNYSVEEGKKPSQPREKKKRLIVEFAIENAQVVARRKEREVKTRERSKVMSEKTDKGPKARGQGKNATSSATVTKAKGSKKRKRVEDDGVESKAVKPEKVVAKPSDEKEQLAKRQRIIGKKRMLRKAKRQGRKS